MHYYPCPNCGRSELITKLKLQKMLKDRTKDGEEWGIYCTCPSCTIDSEVDYETLPDEVKKLFSPMG